MKYFLLSTTTLALCFIVLQALSHAGKGDENQDLINKHPHQVARPSSDPTAQKEAISKKSEITNKLRFARQHYENGNHQHATKRLGEACSLEGVRYLSPK